VDPEETVAITTRVTQEVREVLAVREASEEQVMQEAQVILVLPETLDPTELELLTETRVIRVLQDPQETLELMEQEQHPVIRALPVLLEPTETPVQQVVREIREELRRLTGLESQVLLGTLEIQEPALQTQTKLQEY
jgi:hypothetical protein